MPARLLVHGKAIHDLRIRDHNFAGVDQLWRVFLDTPNRDDEDTWEDAAHHLMWLHSGADADTWQGTVAVREEFLAAVIERLKETATRLRMGDDRASAEQRAERQ